jgi:hypothetical protein
LTRTFACGSAVPDFGPDEDMMPFAADHILLVLAIVAVEANYRSSGTRMEANQHARHAPGSEPIASPYK